MRGPRPTRERARDDGAVGQGQARRFRQRVKVLRDFRRGRMQRLLSAATAASAPPLGPEVFINHHGGPVGNKWAGVAGVVPPRAAATVLPALSALVFLDGAAGVYFHLRGPARKPGGLREATY